jgi:hypothetical protein
MRTPPLGTTLSKLLTWPRCKGLWWGEAPVRSQDIGNSLSRRRHFLRQNLSDQKMYGSYWLSCLEVSRVGGQNSRL